MKLSLPRILLPLDFSEQHVELARYAKQLAQAFGSRITLLHVLTHHYGFDMPGFESETLSNFLSENENKAQKELDTFSQRGFRNVRVKRVLVKGDPAQEIVCYAHSERSISVQTVPGLPDGRLNWRPGYIPSSLLCTLSQVLTFLAKGTVRQNGYVWRAIKQRRLSQSSCIGAMLTQRFIWRQGTSPKRSAPRQRNDAPVCSLLDAAP